MSVFDLEKLLQPLSEDSPCGPNLEYDPVFAEIEQLARGKPEQVLGDKVVPAEEADWKRVKDRALELLGRTKDLRVAVLATRALLRTDGWHGLQAGLDLVHGLVDRYWDAVHPQLDREDNNDPTMRVNTLASLCNADGMLRAVRETDLVESAKLGRFSLRDVLVATGRLQAPSPPDKAPASSAEIEAAFLAADLEDLRGRDQALLACADLVRAIETLLTEKVGAERAASFAELLSVLTAAKQPLALALMRRGVAVAGGEPAPEDGLSARVSGEIASRDDAVRMLDRICEYFEHNEPSSPVPILLRRAKGLVSKDFVSIVRDLAPEGLSQVERIQGPDQK